MVKLTINSNYKWTRCLLLITGIQGNDFHEFDSKNVLDKEVWLFIKIQWEKRHAYLIVKIPCCYFASEWEDKVPQCIYAISLWLVLVSIFQYRSIWMKPQTDLSYILQITIWIIGYQTQTPNHLYLNDWDQKLQVNSLKENAFPKYFR